MSRFLILIAVVLCLVLIFQFFGVQLSTSDMMYGLLLMGWLAFLLVAFPRRRKGETVNKMMLYVGIWAGILMVFFTVYAFRDSIPGLKRLSGTLTPTIAQVDSSGRIVLFRGRNGHFSARVRVNGREVMMMVDTGATVVSIPYELANELGFEADRLRFNQPTSTANGTAFSARVMLNTVELGGYQAQNVRGQISQPGALEDGLLGLSYLNRFKSYTVEGDRMILVP